jgi:hypothetical protein
MRHPRRHEVFRDVGTIYRDKDEQEFVDVIEEPLEPDAAILISSDGLSDMLPGATIAHIVRQHAGAPERVVEALVAAANDAGGRDNVTVVYAEMPLFAERLGRGHASYALTTTEALVAQPETATPPTPSTISPRPGRVRRTVRAVLGSRATWFAVGTLGGIVGALALTAYVATKQVQAPRTLVVAADGTAPFTTIMGALAASRPGDTVRLEPGVYREPVVVSDGVDLAARVPGTVTIVHPRDTTTAVLTIAGAFNVRIAGIRFDADAPAEIGIRIAAPAATLDLVEITGPIRRAIDLSPASSLTVRGSRIAVAGTVLALPEEAHATFVNSVLVRAGGMRRPRSRRPPRRTSSCAAMCSRATAPTSCRALRRRGARNSSRETSSFPENRRRRPPPEAARGRGAAGNAARGFRDRRSEADWPRPVRHGVPRPPSQRRPFRRAEADPASRRER